MSSKILYPVNTWLDSVGIRNGIELNDAEERARCQIES